MGELIPQAALRTATFTGRSPTADLVTEYRVSLPRPLRVQKDQYGFLHDGADENHGFDAREFEALSAKEAQVHWFKRLKTSLQIEGEARTSTASLTVDVRSHHVELTQPQALKGQKPLPLPIMGLYLALAAARFAYDGLPIRRVMHATEKEALLLAVHDPMWWAGVLHKMRDYGSIVVPSSSDAGLFRRFEGGEPLVVDVG